MLTFQDAVSLLHHENTSVDIQANFEKEILPILEKVLTWNPENYDNPSLKQLFNWLVESKRTGEEFSYLFGPMNGYLDYEGRGTYLYKVGLEALAILCPVLEGSWEQAAWFLFIGSICYYKMRDGAFSDHLSAWIILMIGNSDLCPNIHLRINLMSLLYRMVDLDDHNQSQALEWVFSVFPLINTFYNNLDISIINQTLKTFAKVGYLKEFDNVLASKLHGIKISREYATVYDVAYNSALFPNRYTLPLALYNVAALLKTISGFVKHLEEDYGGEIEYNQKKVGIAADLLFIIVSNLKKSSQSPLLLDHLVPCTTTVMKVIISPSIDSHITLVEERIGKLLQLLQIILPKDTFKTKFEDFIAYLQMYFPKLFSYLLVYNGIIM